MIWTDTHTRKVVLLFIHVHDVYYEQNMLQHMGPADICNIAKYLLRTEMAWSELAAFFTHEYVCAAYIHCVISCESLTDIHNISRKSHSRSMPDGKS